MSTPSSAAPAAPSNLVTGAAGASSRFDSEKRQRALELLATLIAGSRVIAALKLLNADPTLVFESLQVQVSPTTSTKVAMEVPLACLKFGVSAGYVFAVANGYPVDTVLSNNATLLQAALGKGRDGTADVGILLGLGASPAAMTDKRTLWSAFSDAFPATGGNYSLVNMLLDAGARFEYDSKLANPFSVLVAAHGWTDADEASSMTRLMTALVKSGHSINSETGSPKMTALYRALGNKNGPAMIALIRCGADTGPEALRGKEFLALLEEQKLGAFKQEAQDALMASHISRAVRAVPATGAATPANEAPAPARRAARSGL